METRPPVPPSEGEQKWPESSTPSEGGRGTMRWDVRPQLPLAGMLQFLTFRRCAETTAKQLTFRRWKRNNTMGCTATDTSREHAAVPHLPKVSRNDGKTAHLPKVGEGQYDGMFGHRYLSRAYCSSSPSEGEQKQQENSPASEGARKWPETSEPYSFRRSKRRRILQNDITEAVEALRRFHSFGRSRENAGKRDSFERSKKE